MSRPWPLTYNLAEWIGNTRLNLNPDVPVWDILICGRNLRFFFYRSLSTEYSIGISLDSGGCVIS